MSLAPLGVKIFEFLPGPIISIDLKSCGLAFGISTNLPSEDNFTSIALIFPAPASSTLYTLPPSFIIVQDSS
ncbi:TPA: hypothetical protein DIC40_03310 [Patescibacteria group bacterium]|nr:hypothetical protein [Candidatus Gracilibacteria bacterium]